MTDGEITKRFKTFWKNRADKIDSGVEKAKNSGCKLDEWTLRILVTKLVDE